MCPVLATHKHTTESTDKRRQTQHTDTQTHTQHTHTRKHTHTYHTDNTQFNTHTHPPARTATHRPAGTATHTHPSRHQRSPLPKRRVSTRSVRRENVGERGAPWLAPGSFGDPILPAAAHTHDAGRPTTPTTQAVGQHRHPLSGLRAKLCGPRRAPAALRPQAASSPTAHGRATSQKFAPAPARAGCPSAPGRPRKAILGKGASG